VTSMLIGMTIVRPISKALVHPKGGLEHRSVTRHSHYAHRILAALRQDPGRTVIHGRYGTRSALDLERSIVDAAVALVRSGADAGAPVAILTEPNQPVMLSARYAAHLLGIAVVHIRSMNPRSDLESFPLATQIEILRTVGARTLVTDAANAERGRLLAQETGGTSVLAAGTRPDRDTPEFAPYRPADLAVIDFTSGSTGTPKMVRQLFGTREALIQRLAASSEAPVTLLSVTPISHTTAPMIDATLSNGGTIVLHDGFDAGSVLRAIAAHRVTETYLAVPQLYALLDEPGIAGADLESLRRVVYSGTPAAPARIAEAVEIFGDRLVQVYGTTETGGITSLTPMDHREPELLGTVGRPFPWVRLELREPNSASTVEPGQAGEICVRSPTTMAGYVGERACGADWLRTGDLGRWDRHGYLELVGRVDDVIKNGGLKLYPTAIEQALLRHPQVRNAAVYGVRDHDYVEHVHAAVVLRKGARCGADELRGHVAGLLSELHAPAVVEFRHEIPLRESGKPDHNLLRTGRKGIS
jgi:fatty-acyl-CoA synthase